MAALVPDARADDIDRQARENQQAVQRDDAAVDQQFEHDRARTPAAAAVIRSGPGMGLGGIVGIIGCSLHYGGGQPPVEP